MPWSNVNGILDYDQTSMPGWSVTAGNLLIVGILDQVASSTITLSDGVNTWTRIGTALTGSGPPVMAFTATWFYAIAATTTSITPAFTGLGGGHHGPWGAQYSHSGGTVPADTLVAATQTGQLPDDSGSTATDGDTSGAATPGFDGCLIVGWIGNVQNQGGTGASTFAPGTSFTERAASSDDSTTFEMIWAVEDREQTTSASAAATWTATTTNSYAAFVAFFKPPGVAGQPAARRIAQETPGLAVGSVRRM
jgi:hypothetical protein